MSNRKQRYPHHKTFRASDDLVALIRLAVEHESRGRDPLTENEVIRNALRRTYGHLLDSSEQVDQ